MHVERQNGTAKFWITPVSLARSMGMSDAELRRATRAVERNSGYFLEVWHEFIGS